MRHRSLLVSAVFVFGLGVSACAVGADEGRAGESTGATADPLTVFPFPPMHDQILKALLAARHDWEKHCENTAFPTYFFVSTKTVADDCTKSIKGTDGTWKPDGFLLHGHAMCRYHWVAGEGGFMPDRDALEARASKNFIDAPQIYGDCLGEDRVVCNGAQGSCKSASGVIGTVREPMIEDGSIDPTPNLGMAGCPKCGMIRNNKLYVVLPPEWLLDDAGHPRKLYAVGRDKSYVVFTAPQDTQVATIQMPGSIDLSRKLDTPEGEPIYITPMPVDQLFD